jgi:hypothetical protein
MSHLPVRRTVVSLSLALAGGAANAADFVVDALLNSSTGGTGVSTVSLTAGESFSVLVDPTDLWNAGALPRWSNANGLTGPLFATGTDDSGEAAGTQIGANFGTHTQGNLSAAFGTLVGQIDSGDFFVVGTSFTGVASDTGTLKLFYWDSNFGDNTQFITASVTVGAIPEPETYALMLAGLGLVGWTARRRRG